MVLVKSMIVAVKKSNNIVLNMMIFLQEKDKALVQKEIRQNAEILIKNKVDFIILEVFQ